jgi:hypothetical protein
MPTYSNASSGYFWRSRLRSVGIDEDTFMSSTTPSRNGTVPVRNDGQTLMSESHPYKLLGKGGNKEIGGDFKSQRIEVHLEPWGTKQFVRTGPPLGMEETTWLPSADFDVLSQYKRANPGSFDEVHFRTWLEATHPLPYKSDSYMDNWGASVIASVKPTNPVADLATTLAEFASEGRVFTLPGKAIRPDKEYLNYSFGVSPTVGFAKDLRKAVSNRENIISQYERDSGKRVRRQFNPPPEITTTKQIQSPVSLWSFGFSGPSPYVAGNGTLIKTTTNKTYMWFSGAFTYHLPKRGWRSDLARLDKLYGVVPQPNSTFWELTPYSWLIDYFTEQGAYQENLDAFRKDGLVMPYGYVMCKQQRTVEYSWTGFVWKGASTESYTRKGSIQYTTMQRRSATPYGFGITSSQLTTKQLSIIAALGLSKL